MLHTQKSQKKKNVHIFQTLEKVREPHRSAMEQRKGNTLHTVLGNSQSDILSYMLLFRLNKQCKVAILNRPEV